MIKIREARTSDIEQLSKLFDTYRIFYNKSSDIAGAKQFLLERIEKKESVIFVAENDVNKLLGFVQLYPVFSSTKMKRLWLLNDLFVDEAHRGEGVSVELIKKAKEFAKITNAAGILLETAKNNDIGNSLYPNVGFQIDTEHNFYTWDNS